jgi:hypothetical protein
MVTHAALQLVPPSPLELVLELVLVELVLVELVLWVLEPPAELLCVALAAPPVPAVVELPEPQAMMAGDAMRASLTRL